MTNEELTRRALAVVAGRRQKALTLSLIHIYPKGVNAKAVAAAARKQIPAVGTGGTSIANTQAAGVRVISASGTTGTTNRTRAVAFISALSKEWKLKYMPVIGSSAAGAGAVQGLSLIHI